MVARLPRSPRFVLAASACTHALAALPARADVMKHVNLMYKVVSITVQPDSCKDLLLANAHHLRGS